MKIYGQSSGFSRRRSFPHPLAAPWSPPPAAGNNARYEDEYGSSKKGGKDEELYFKGSSFLE